MNERLRQLTAGLMLTTLAASAPSVADGFSGPLALTCQYYMAFQACHTGEDDCSDPRNHTVHLATSPNGEDWTLHDTSRDGGNVPDWVAQGSVPDIFKHDGSLYVYFLKPEYANPHLRKIFDYSLNEIDSGTSVNLYSTTDSYGYVDPSLLSVDDYVFLFYLPGVGSGDPASCSSYPCTKEIHVADAIDMENFLHFPRAASTLTAVSETLSASPEVLADPDVIAFGGEYLLYISRGADVSVYSSPSPYIPFSFQGWVSTGEGGVPGAIVNASGDVWIYVTQNDGTGITGIWRGESADGVTAPASYEEVMTGAELFGDSEIMVASPSLEKHGVGCNQLHDIGPGLSLPYARGFADDPNLLMEDLRPVLQP